MYMTTHHFNDEDTNNEAEILEHLSSFLKLFRRSVNLAELVASLV